MAVTIEQLENPIKWDEPQFAGMLKDLQGNILKGHGRTSTRHLLLTVKPGKAVAARTGLAKIAPDVTDALTQLQDAERIRNGGVGGGRALFIFLSRAGYAALGAKPNRIPTEASFGLGMGHAATMAKLADPPRAQWDSSFAKPVHAMVLIADTSRRLCRLAQSEILSKLGTGWAVAGVEEGQAIFDDDGNGLEHFGYMDGRSQPLMLTDEIGRETNDAGGVANLKWSAFLGPSRLALVADPAGKTVESFGSYFVMRKLGQDVAGFKAAEKALAKAQAHAASANGVALPHPELAGAMMVGRFEDGSPVITHAIAAGGTPDNNFNYAGDPSGNKCPLHAHIRKTNPRNGLEVDSIMPRRGIPFGGQEGSGDDVGLIFMAYNKKIADQFEFIQQSWVNNEDFLVPGTGVDPIIGQMANRRPSYGNCPIAHGDVRHHAGDFQQFVTMRGGEYFFAPSKSGLTNLV